MANFIAVQIPFEVFLPPLGNNDQEIDDFIKYQEPFINFLAKNINDLTDKTIGTSETLDLFIHLISIFDFLKKDVITDVNYPLYALIYKKYSDNIILKFNKKLNDFVGTENIPYDSPKMINNFVSKFLDYIKIAVNEKIQELDDEKNKSIENAKKENIYDDVMKLEIDSHFRNLKDSVINTNYEKILKINKDVFSIVESWPPWLKKPDFLKNTVTTTFQGLKLRVAIHELMPNFTRSLDYDSLSTEVKKHIVQLCKDRKKSLLEELEKNKDDFSSAEEFKGVYNIIDNIDIDKEYEAKNKMHEVIFFWPDLLYPEPIELQKTKDITEFYNRATFDLGQIKMYKIVRCDN
jgi:hypothetical protein